MRSGGVLGLGEEAPRFETISIPITAAGLQVLEFSREWSNWSFQITGAVPAARSVLVGLARPQQSAQSVISTASEAIDPTTHLGVASLERSTRFANVYVVTATPGATLHVTGMECVPVPAAGSGGGSSSGEVDVIALAGAVAGLAALPALSVFPYGSPGLACNAAAWDQVPVALADAATTLILAGDANHRAVLIQSLWTAGQLIHIRRTSTNADAGLAIYGSGQRPVEIPCGGSDIYGRNNSGAGRTVSLSAIRAA